VLTVPQHANAQIIPYIEFVSSSANLLTTNEGQPDRGWFRIQFKISAEDDDIYIPNNPPGFFWDTFPSTASVVTLSTNLRKLSGSTQIGNFYKISTGNTGSFDATFVIEAQESRFVGIEITSINWSLQNNFDQSLNTSTEFVGELRSPSLYMQDVPEPSTIILVFLGAGLLPKTRRAS